MKRTWRCPECGRTQRLSYEEIVEVGTPYCTCGDSVEMELQPDQPIEVIVEVVGGNVTAVYASDKSLRVSILDHDNLCDGSASENERQRADTLKKKAKRLRTVY